MAFEVDEDILQDFLVEASEILEQLSEQLVDLEKRPDDKNLLNAIFRGVWPMVLVLVITLGILLAFPSISLWLPSMMD